MKITISKSQWDKLGKTAKTNTIKDGSGQTVAKVQTFGDQQFPIIILKGKWLFEAGFTPSDVLSVDASQGQLTLSVSQPATDEVKEKYKNIYAPKPKVAPVGTPINIYPTYKRTKPEKDILFVPENVKVPENNSK